jgi:hypothetical protein
MEGNAMPVQSQIPLSYEADPIRPSSPDIVRVHRMRSGFTGQNPLPLPLLLSAPHPSRYTVINVLAIRYCIFVSFSGRGRSFWHGS